MSTLAVKQVKLGNDIDPSKNFLIEVPSVADGTLTIKRQNGTNVLSIDATGKAVIPGVVGTVAQVGGIPTGQVVERGSNANGEYVRFADGTQICFSGPRGSPGTAWKTSFLALTFAAAFSGIPVITFSLARDNTVYSSIAMLISDGTTPTNTGFKVGGPLGVTDTGTSLDIRYTAIGRWF